MNRNLFKGGLGVASIVTAVAMVALSTGPAAAATGSTGEGDASASTGTGLFSILDTGKCKAVDTASTDKGTPTGRCGDGLNLNNQIKAFSQTATAPGDGTSTGKASVAPIDVTNLGTTLDLTGLVSGLSNINTGTILDDVIGALTNNPVLQNALNLVKTQVLSKIDAALQPALAAVLKNLPLALKIGAVNAHCSASPGTATGNSTVAGLDLVVSLGGQDIKVPITLKTAPNSNLLIGAPQDLVDGLLDGIGATLTTSLNGSLAGLAGVTGAVKPIVDKILETLEPSLLTQVSKALAPILKGTVNEQKPVSPSKTGEIAVTALDLTVLGSNNLKLARTHCGPDTRVGTGPSASPSEPPSGPKSPNVPTNVDSGMGGNGGHADEILAAGAALIALLGAGGTLAYRRYGMPRG